MNAKIKETGKWITINPCNDGFYDVETHDIYEPDELDFVPEFDWQSFRREAAKDAMCQLIGMGRDDGYKYSPEEVASYAIVYADELIKQLQERR